jgi:hypothetical protein
LVIEIKFVVWVKLVTRAKLAREEMPVRQLKLVIVHLKLVREDKTGNANKIGNRVKNCYFDSNW